MGNEMVGNTHYMLPDYGRILSFEVVKRKLADKLEVRMQILVERKVIESRRKNHCEEYVAFMESEIELIQYILNTKEIE